MKKIVFLIIASLLVIGLILPGCDGGDGNGVVTRPNILIGIPYPAGSIQGNGMCKGAELARDEINVAGVSVYNASSNTTTVYNIKLLERDDNEINNPTQAYTAVEWLITNGGAQFIIGGFRTEAVEPMIQGPIKTHEVPFFVCGASTGELLSGGISYGASIWPTGYGTPYYVYNASTSAHYKYVMRATPFNSGFLLGMVMSAFSQVSQEVQTALNWTWNATGTGTWPHYLRVAIFAENLTWAFPIVYGYQKLLNMATGFGYLFGWNLTGTYTTSDNPSSSVVDAALNAIQAKKNQLILTCTSGPVGETFGIRMAALNITAIPIGINVEAQDPNYAITTGEPNYEITTGTWATGVAQTGLTTAFLNAYQSYTGSFPVYTAASYDMIYGLKAAIEATDSLDKDDITDYLRTHSRTITSGIAQYYPEWDQVSHAGKWDTYFQHLFCHQFPALNLSQVNAIYSTLGYDAGFNYTMPPYTTNDLVFGPGYLTGLGLQWVSGSRVCMWPKAGYDNPYGAPYPPMLPIIYKLPPQTSLVKALVGLNWDGTLEYTGTGTTTIPAPYLNVWNGWFP